MKVEKKDGEITLTGDGEKLLLFVNTQDEITICFDPDLEDSESTLSDASLSLVDAMELRKALTEMINILLGQLRTKFGEDLDLFKLKSGDGK